MGVTPEAVINFLHSLFEKKRSHKYLENSKAAIFWSIEDSQEDASHLRKNVQIRKFMRGCFLKNPSVPRYASTWDAGHVLDFFSAHPVEARSPFLDLSRRVVTLLALISHQRVQYLHSLRRSKNSMLLTERKLTVYSLGRNKTDTPRRHMAPLEFEKFPENPQWCIVFLMQLYVSVRDALAPDSEDRLFISSEPPFHGAAKDTISNWIRRCLADAGVDINVFGPHTTRHASTSAVARNLPITSVLKRVGWTSASTFHAHYFRPVIKDAHVVRQLHNKD